MTVIFPNRAYSIVFSIDHNQATQDPQLDRRQPGLKATRHESMPGKQSCVWHENQKQPHIFPRDQLVNPRSTTRDDSRDPSHEPESQGRLKCVASVTWFPNRRVDTPNGPERNGKAPHQYHEAIGTRLHAYVPPDRSVRRPHSIGRASLGKCGLRHRKTLQLERSRASGPVTISCSCCSDMWDPDIDILVVWSCRIRESLSEHHR